MLRASSRQSLLLKSSACNHSGSNTVDTSNIHRAQPFATGASVTINFSKKLLHSFVPYLLAGRYNVQQLVGQSVLKQLRFLDFDKRKLDATL